MPRSAQSKPPVQQNSIRHCEQVAKDTEEKILCRSPISQRSHVGNLRQTIQGKGVIHKRVETAGVYPLVRPRGVSALPPPRGAANSRAPQSAALRLISGKKPTVHNQKPVLYKTQRS